MAAALTWPPAFRTARSQRGSELIELALAMPMLILVIVALFDFGFLFQRFLAVTNAAREGARIAVLGGYSATDVQARVAGYLTASGVVETPTTTVTTIVLTPGTGPSFNAVRVRVVCTYAFTWLAPLAAVFGGGTPTVPLEAVAVMRIEST